MQDTTKTVHLYLAKSLIIKSGGRILHVLRFCTMQQILHGVFLGAARLFFVRVLSNQSVKQSITIFKSQWNVAEGKTLY